MTRTLATAVLFGTILFASVPVRAADEASVQEAHALFNEGVALFGRGDFEHARVKFVAANALVKSADILWNLALAEAKCGRAADALNHFHAYARDPKARSEDVREAAQKWIPLLESQAGELDIDGTADLVVSVDGTRVGSLPLADPLAVTAGTHHVEARLGRDTIVRDVAVRAGQVIGVHLVAPSSSPPALSAASVPTAELATSSALAPAPPPASDATASAKPTAPLRLWLTVGLGVASAAALGTGIYFAAQSNHEASRANQIGSGLPPSGCVNPSAPGCASLSQTLASENRDHTAEVSLYVGAGALAAGAVAAWLFLPKTVDARAVALPYLAPGVVGAQWATHF